jgi:uncharacterized membrane protein
MMPAFNSIAVVAVCLGSVMFLISGLKAGKETGRRLRQFSVLAGLVGLIWVGLQLFASFYATSLRQYRHIALAFFFTRHLWGGIMAGFFLRFILKSKPLLAGSLTLLVVFNAFVIVRQLPWVTRFVFIGEGVFAGMSLTSLFLLWFDREEKSSSQ